MHCDEVIRELAVPTDDRDSAALAEHLANCPSCAGWAKRDAQFDRLWDATRPVEPSPQIWDTVWAHIASSLDSSTPAEFEAFASPMATLNGSVARLKCHSCRPSVVPLPPVELGGDRSDRSGPSRRRLARRGIDLA